jgi:DNA-binding LacI/PurR family transcriptional regulator
MPTTENPLTIRGLASRLRLSAMTVSRALRNAPGVSAATRRLVLEAAERRGYRPDPALAVLNAYRHGQRHRLAHETIAFLTHYPVSALADGAEALTRYYFGAKARATELGYALEHLLLGEHDLTDRRASQILLSRGIRGLLVGPLAREASSPRLDWSRFSTVALGDSLLAPALATVATNYAHGMELAWQKAWARGYRRIGLVLRDDTRAANGTLQAAHLFQQQTSGSVAIPTFITPDFFSAGIAAWVRQHEPDLIISTEHQHYEHLVENLGTAAKRIRFLSLNASPRLDIGGIDPGLEHVGEHAMTSLHLKLVQRQTGVPARRELTLVDGAWKEGRGMWRLPHVRNRSSSER